MIDQQKAKEEYELYLEKAKNDKRILGITLGGGRGKGVSSENSDYDVILVTADDEIENIKNEYPKTEYVDSIPYSISEFRERAKSGTRTQYDKYTFTHNKAIVDKTGEIQKLIDEKGALEPEQIEKIIRDALGGYHNSLYRSVKNLRDGNSLAGHLDATETIPRILTFIFALEGRVRPFNKFLVWELENYPLTKLPINSSEFISKIETIAKTGNTETQKEILKIVQKLATENGYPDEIEKWHGYYFG